MINGAQAVKVFLLAYLAWMVLDFLIKTSRKEGYVPLYLMAVWYAAILFSVADFRLLIEFLRLHTTIMYHGPAWINYSCLVFFAGGAWLRYLIVQTLRRHDAPDRPIEAGPFRVLRYPLYTAFLLQLFSIIFFFGSGGGLLLVLLGGIPLVLREIAREERENEEEFGHAFVEYKSRTKRLVPFIW